MCSQAPLVPEGQRLEQWSRLDQDTPALGCPLQQLDRMDGEAGGQGKESQKEGGGGGGRRWEQEPLSTAPLCLPFGWSACTSLAGAAVRESGLGQWPLRCLQDVGLGVGVGASASPSGMRGAEALPGGCWEGQGSSRFGGPPPTHIPSEPSKGLIHSSQACHAQVSLLCPPLPASSPFSLHCLQGREGGGAGPARTRWLPPYTFQHSKGHFPKPTQNETI